MTTLHRDWAEAGLRDGKDAVEMLRALADEADSLQALLDGIRSAGKLPDPAQVGHN